ncbi:MAG: glycosyltransferase family 2 protein [Candidatus Methylomirabilales bacterium]
MSADVAVIIVTFESREYIASCLASLRETQGRVRVIVVDNASRDGTPQVVRERFPHVTLVTLPRNLGFAAGVNRGIRECPGATFFFLLNPDSIALPEAIPRMVAFAQKHPRVGILGPRVFDDLECRTVQPSCRQFPTLMTALFNRHSLLTKLFKGNRFSRTYLYLDEDLSGPRPVGWVSGCAMLVRREVIEQLGPLDEEFFFFCEDIDFCWRAHKADWEVMYFPEASVVHLLGKSAEQVRYRTLIAKHRGMVRLYRKHIRKTFITDLLVLAAGWARLGLLLGREAFRRRRSS